MSLACRRLLLPAVLAVLSAACAGESASPPVAGGDAQAAALSFDVDGGVLTAAPSEEVKVRIRSHGIIGSVTLSLDGDYADASLDRGTAKLDGGGDGEFVLRAPSVPATFSVVAVASGVKARLDVAVSRDGFATIRVSPSYQGKRPVTIVAASAFLQTTCADLAKLPPKDGAPLVVGTASETLVLPKVPAGARVAVSVRIAHYASGCVDLEALTPNETKDTTVKLFDRPLATDAANLASTFTFAPDPPDKASWNAVLAAAQTEVMNTFFPDLEAKRLLDAMADAAPSPAEKSAFNAKRTQQSWDSATTTWLSQHAPSMHSRAVTWSSASLPTILGDLVGPLVGAPDQKAVFTPSTLGTLDAVKAGISAAAPFSLTADTDDTLHLHGILVFLPTRLVAAGADRRAIVDFPAAKGVDSALDLAVDCAGLGNALANGGYVYSTCDGSCAAALCRTAITAQWSGAADLSSKLGGSVLLDVTASASSAGGEDAEPVSFDGAWVGQFTGTSMTAFACKGTVKGYTPPN